MTPEEQQEAKAEIEGLMARSRAAQAKIADYTQDQVDNLIKAMVKSVGQPGRAEDIAKFTVEESSSATTMASFLKFTGRPELRCMTSFLTSPLACLEEDHERNIVKIAKPVGVIGALSPSTNPEATW